ncbi:class I SAM-dependent methyltransferase [Motilimonas sp. E26]|uniref:class I SAM-dependent methyltransferase n=1 Tax=Motilimonas sp. E26 TaxID=2865674 RepID=UPI001E43AF59
MTQWVGFYCDELICYDAENFLLSVLVIPLLADFPELNADADKLRKKWGFSAKRTPDDLLVLVLTATQLELRKVDEPKLGAVAVDFVTGAAAHRRKFGGGKGQTIAKAIGIKAKAGLTVIDATAGLGRDAFVFASLGCQVTLVERSPVVAALLEDGLQRAYRDPEIGAWMQANMQLQFDSGIDWLAHAQADVVYLDPMFPHKKKSALVKKEMRVFQHLVGPDLDADALLAPAMSAAQYRVVVKRPDYAPWLAQQKPTLAFTTKSNRFDVYVNKGLT